MNTPHRFVLQPGSTTYQQIWPQILADTRRILHAVRRRGIVLAGPRGTGQPLLDPARGIGFTGDITAGYACESLWLPAPGPAAPGAPTDARIFGHAATVRAPYDLAVTTVLLRCHLLAPDVVAIGGQPWRSWTSPPGANARDLVTDLFGIRVTASPLTDVTTGMALTQSGRWIDPRLATEPVVVTRDNT
ncbi:hypothetical protein AB0B31_11015 [Catellatospora citrea]|uniref:hypothetical protein n=1 Tax=Catellatospora citrea TaxID=53366 RepID=UPI0033EDA382